jgi:hypothetical protein
MVEKFPENAAELSRRYRLDKPIIGFAERSLLLDLAVSAGLATRAAAMGAAPGEAKAAEMRAQAVGVAMDLVAALEKVGRKDRDYHVGQGSNTLPLATAYDFLHADLSPEQRQRIVRTLIDYCFVPTLEAMFINGPDAPKTFWVTGYNNWTTINLGGAIGFALALRPGDDPGPVAALKFGGETVSRTIGEHLAEFLPIALTNLRRGFLVLRNNNGLQPEGSGYHHDTVLPLYGLVASLEGAFADASKRPAPVAEFLEDARQTARVHINAGIHHAGPVGRDWEYADGTWPLTSLPINLLIAHYAREAKAPLADAAAWRALQLAASSDLGLHVLYRCLHATMPKVDPATIPTAEYFFTRLVRPEEKEVAINEFVVTWRQNFTDPQAAGVFFKGGDRRSDYHSHSDIGTFLYDALGVRWAVDIGNAAGYPYYFRDGIRQWEAVTTYQAYPKKAAAHNTLVINPAINDYTKRLVPPPRDWYWQFNPDQCLFSGKVPPICPVSELQTGAATSVFRGAVELAPAYQYHGIRLPQPGEEEPSRRWFEFDRGTGVLAIRDRLFFTEQTGNDVHWFLNVPPASEITRLGPDRLLLSVQRGAEKTWVHCLLELVSAEGGEHDGLRFGRGDENLPPGQPADDVLWGYANAKPHRERGRKIALRLQQVGPHAALTTRLTPRPELTSLLPETAARSL